jgi:hypothetical protein
MGIQRGGEVQAAAWILNLAAGVATRPSSCWPFSRMRRRRLKEKVSDLEEERASVEQSLPRPGGEVRGLPNGSD